MRGSWVSASDAASRTSAEARVALSLAWCLALARKLIWSGPAPSSEPTCRIRTLASPATRPPSCDAICASVSGPPMSFGGGFAGFQRLDHLVGDVDARVRVSGFLEDDVVLLRLGDLADDAVGLFDDLREFLVATHVHVFLVFALLALEVPALLAE